MARRNDFGQAIGDPLPAGWSAPPFPSNEPMTGRFAQLERMSAERHAKALFDANATAPTDANWTYLPYGPYDSLTDYRTWMESQEDLPDPQFWAIHDLDRGRPVGVASYLRIDPAAGSIEVGHINLSPLAQRTPVSTEAMFLMMGRAFDLGYRRYEWKCDALNQPSRDAATRLGFSFEGVFRQATHYKGRNRDTAWFSIVDGEWPAVRREFLTWLAPENFDANGRQVKRLQAGGLDT